MKGSQLPRPNKPRDVLAEDHLARRIAAERDARGWTNDGLAKRMTDAGCPMSGSAIFKIEKGEPRRRIVVDELVAFAKVLDIPIAELLLPAELWHAAELGPLLEAWLSNMRRRSQAIALLTEEEQQLRADVQAAVSRFPDAEGFVQRFFEESAPASWSGRLADIVLTEED